MTRGRRYAADALRYIALAVTESSSETRRGGGSAERRGGRMRMIVRLPVMRRSFMRIRPAAANSQIYLSGLTGTGTEMALRPSRRTRRRHGSYVQQITFRRLSAISGRRPAAGRGKKRIYRGFSPPAVFTPPPTKIARYRRIPISRPDTLANMP